MASEILGKTVLASYGLSDDVQPEESDDGVDTERAESASEDSLDAETEVTEPEANNEEEEPETLEEDNETDGEKVDPKEVQTRKFQSLYDSEKARNDALQTQLNQFYSEFQQLKQTTTTEQEKKAIDAIGEDEDLVNVKTLKQALTTAKPKTDDTLKQIQEQWNARVRAQNEWLQGQSDIKEVVEYVGQDLMKDPVASKTPTDTVGYYYLAKAKMLEKQVKELTKKLSAVKKAPGKEPIPPTGGQSRVASSRPKVENLSQLTDMERRLKKLVDRSR